jgi:hypothetical protein
MGDGMNPFGDTKDEVVLPGNRTIILRQEANDIGSDVSRRVETAIRKQLVPKRFRHINWGDYCDCRTDFWDKYIIQPEDIYSEDLEEYAKKIHTNKIIEDVAGRVAEDFRDDVVEEPWPEVLTEDGTMMAVLGFRPPAFPFYQNVKGTFGKKRVVVFYDLSPSMTLFFPYMCRMTDYLENNMDMFFARNVVGDPGVIAFAGSIQELTKEQIADMRKGNLECGWSTCYDELVEYCIDKINTAEVDAIICFTDGESGVSAENIERFNQTGKTMYRVYFTEDQKYNKDRIVESDLDLLKGTSFTIRAPRTDLAEI